MPNEDVAGQAGQGSPGPAAQPPDEGFDRWTKDNPGRLLAVTARAARALLTSRLAPEDATFGMWTAIAMLQADGPLIQRELAARLAVEGPTLTRQLDRLEALGLITRSRSADDRRTARVDLTDEGRATYERLSTVVMAATRQLLTGFTAADVATLRSLLARIEQNAQDQAAVDGTAGPGGGAGPAG